MSQIKLVIYILFAFLVAVFSVYNQEPVTLRFFGSETAISLVVVVLGAILVGVVLTAFLGFLSQSRLKKRISVLDREAADLKEKEKKLQLKIRELEEKLEEDSPGKGKDLNRRDEGIE